MATEIVLGWTPNSTAPYFDQGYKAGGRLNSAPTTPTADYFQDTFSSGDWLKQRPGGGDFWQGVNGTIVTSTAGANPGTSTIVYNTNAVNIEATQGEDWTAKVGDYAMRILYPAGLVGNYISRWKIQESDAMPEIYVAFWLKVPSNFDHQTGNNKLFWMWMDGRSQNGNGSTVGMEYRPGTPSGSANWYCKVGAGSSVTGPDQQSSAFVTLPDDAGKWMEICIYAKAESSPNADDGLMKVWRRWEGSDVFTNTHNLNGQPIKLPDDNLAPQGFCECEMMGYNNGAYATDTEFLLDDIRISSTPLVPEGTAGL